MKCKVYIFIALITVVRLFSIAAAQNDRNDPAGLEAMKKVRHYLAEVKKEYDSGGFENAAAYLDSARQYSAEHPDIIYYQSLVFIARNDTVSAISELESGLEKAPLSRRIKILLARLEFSRNEFTEASRLLDQVLAISPRESEALYLKGLIYSAQGDSIQAVSTLKQALQTALDRNRP